jgi:DNA repair protein RadC
MIVSESRVQIRDAKDIAKLICSILDCRNEEDRHKEFFYVSLLNSQNSVIAVDIIGIGTVNSCDVPMRECFRLAIVKNASSIILSHNHPSGTITPSPEDDKLTAGCHQIGKMLNIRVLDHVIVSGDPDIYYSYLDNRKL